MYRKNRKAWYKHFDFMFLDLVCVELSFVLALCMRFGINVFQKLIQDAEWSAPYYRIMMFVLALHAIQVFFMEPYSGILKRNAAEEVKRVLTYNLFMIVGVVFILFAEQTSDIYSRIVLFVTPIINCALMFVYRHCYKKYLQRHINKSENQENMLLVAPIGHVNGILHRFEKNPINTVRIVGIVLTDDMAQLEAAATYEDEDGNVVSLDDYKNGTAATSIRGIPVVGTLMNPYEYARANVVDEVLICSESDLAEELAEGYIEMGITVHISIQDLVQLPKASLNKVNGMSVITASVNTVTLRQLVIKRLVDIFFGFIGSVVTLLLTLIIAPMMWIADPGPVFFRQERVGKNGRTFKIWKFRSMYMDAEERKAELMAQNKMSGLMFKMDDDPRIIGAGKKFSLGKFLRESSIDELPQSFNILAGSMSVVGTRPPTVNEYKEYEKHHKGRLAAKPGLTGMWQVSGRSDITDFEEVVRLDKEYIDNFSLRLDLEIILKTFKVVLGRKGSV